MRAKTLTVAKRNRKERTRKWMRREMARKWMRREMARKPRPPPPCRTLGSISKYDLRKMNNLTTEKNDVNFERKSWKEEN